MPLFSQLVYVLSGEKRRYVSSMLREDIIDALAGVLTLDGAVRLALRIDDVELLYGVLGGGQPQGSVVQPIRPV
jgi:hypothetical protein